MPASVNRPGLALHEVDVLRVSGGWREVELVQGRAATERQRRLQHLVAEYVEEGQGDHQVLLDVVVVGPRRDGPPAHDVGLRQHRSVRLRLDVDDDVPARIALGRTGRRGLARSEGHPSDPPRP